MINIISEFGLILGIIITVISAKKHNKKLKYIGITLIALCLICLVPSFISGFMQGFRDTANIH